VIILENKMGSKLIEIFRKILSQNMPQVQMGKNLVAQLGCSRNWSSNHFSFENLEFHGT
jgi:hypothetical protein